MNTTDFINQDWVKEEIKKRIAYYPNTGLLVWKPRKSAAFNDKFAGKTLGYTEIQKCGYIYNSVMLEIKGRKVKVSSGRLAWLLHNGDWPKETVDHIDRDTLNNKIINLRDVTQAVNNENRREYNKGISKNISLYGGRFWRVYFFCKYFGQSTCFGKALRIREQARKELGLEPMLTNLVGPESKS